MGANYARMATLTHFKRLIERLCVEFGIHLDVMMDKETV